MARTKRKKKLNDMKLSSYIRDCLLCLFLGISGLFNGIFYFTLELRNINFQLLLCVNKASVLKERQRGNAFIPCLSTAKLITPVNLSGSTSLIIRCQGQRMGNGHLSAVRSL